MSEVLFYHLTEYSLEQALPGLLERSLERGWNVVIQTVTEKRRDELDAHLWTYRDDTFLPHGAENNGQTGAAGEPRDQPIWLTTSTENPNKAVVRFMVEGSVPGSIQDYTRVIYMFDGHDEDAVAGARERWKIEKEAGHDLTYWQQDDEGRWAKRG